MADIVTGILKHTFGFLAKKIRKEVADRLKDGDVTDEECRRLIVRELDELKGKLDGLARKDLLSSLCFLQEGINGLYQSLLQFPSDQNTEESSEQATLVEASSSNAVGPDPSSSINEAAALINAIASLKIHSNERFKSAVESFKLAREKATEAFCNEALSIEDRIQACQVRMMARILEKLEDPEASVSDCLQYLKQLHDVGAIREIFSVLMHGGMKSRFNRVKRLNNAASVQEINQILFDFAKKFTRSLLTSILRWPIILLGKETSYRPVLGEIKLIKKLRESGVGVTSPYPDFTFPDTIESSAINSKGDIVAEVYRLKTVKIFKRSGESRTVCEFPNGMNVIAMDVDTEDNIYVITRARQSGIKLFIFDENGNKKVEHPLSLPSYCQSILLQMAVKNDGSIATLIYDNKTVFIGYACVEGNSYEATSRFCAKEVNSYLSSAYLWISDSNETKVLIRDGFTVLIYTENGELQRKIEVPHEDGTVRNVAINHVTKRILVKTLKNSRLSLLSFSESGELSYSKYFECNDWYELCARIISHPNGAIALVNAKKAILLQR